MTDQTSKPWYTVGLDLGQAQDFTALGIVESQFVPTGVTLSPRRSPYDFFGPVAVQETVMKHRLRHLHRYPLRTGYPAIVKDVVGLLGRAPLVDHNTVLVVDATGVGRPVVDLFLEESFSAAMIPVTITNGTTVTNDEYGNWGVPKRNLVSSVQILLQSGDLKIAKGLELADTLTEELAGFRVKISLTGHDSYGAGESWRSARHDDLVLAVALACWQASKPIVEMDIL